MNSLILTSFALLSLAIAGFLPKYVEPKIDPEKRLLATPPPFIEHLTFGYKTLVSNFLWLRVIQDFDTCTQPALAEYETISEKADRAFQTDSKEKIEILERLSVTEVVPTKFCPLSWPFFMLDAITNLDPRFRFAYLFGGTTLSVTLDDYPGASRIFEKGLKAYPNDWPLLYRAGYHQLYDLKNPGKAALLLSRAAENGAPPWLKSLASRLLTLSGQAEMALRVLYEYREIVKGAEALKGVDERIDALKKILKEAK